MTYLNQLSKLAEEINEIFLKNSPYLCKVNNNGVWGINFEVRPCEFSSQKTIMAQISEAGQNKISIYLQEKYGQTPTWHHGHSLGFYTRDGNFNTFIKE